MESRKTLRGCLSFLKKIALTPMRLEREHFYLREARWLRDVFHDGDTILDIGSGVGCFADAMLKEVPETQVICTDVEDRHRSSAPFYLADSKSLPFPDKSFDAVTILYMLHHTSDPRGVLREAKRVSRGKIIVDEDTYLNDLERFAYMLHLRIYRLMFPLSSISLVRTDEDWQKVFQEVGLIIKDKHHVRKVFGYPITRYRYILEFSTNQMPIQNKNNMSISDQ